MPPECKTKGRTYGLRHSTHNKVINGGKYATGMQDEGEDLWAEAQHTHNKVINGGKYATGMHDEGEDGGGDGENRKDNREEGEYRIYEYKKIFLL